MDDGDAYAVKDICRPESKEPSVANFTAAILATTATDPLSSKYKLSIR
jgi:hypothetical protein